MKRGEVSALTKLILAAIVGFLMIFVAFVILLPFSKTESDKEACRLSVLAMAKTKIIQSSPLVKELNCKTQFIEVTDKIVRKNDQLVATLDTETDKARDEVNKIVADEMHDCWYQMGEGTADPWGDWSVANTKHCVVCSEIKFSKEAKDKFQTIYGLDSYLCKEKVPGKDYTYCSYLFGENKISELNKGATIETQDEHSVVFVLNDVGNLGIVGRAAVGCGTGAGIATKAPILLLPVAGCVVGGGASIFEVVVKDKDGKETAKKLQADILMLKTKDIREQCDQLY